MCKISRIITSLMIAGKVNIQSLIHKKVTGKQEYLNPRFTKLLLLDPLIKTLSCSVVGNEINCKFALDKGTCQIPEM